jgi:hypothetical protein
LICALSPDLQIAHQCELKVVVIICVDLHEAIVSWSRGDENHAVVMMWRQQSLWLRTLIGRSGLLWRAPRSQRKVSQRVGDGRQPIATDDSRCAGGEHG